MDQQAGVAGAEREGVDGHVERVVFGVQGERDERLAESQGPGLQSAEFGLEEELF